MKTLRAFLALAWFGAALIAATERNDIFTQWAYRYGVAASMGLAFVSGTLTLALGYRLATAEHRPQLIGLSALILVPLLGLLGSDGVRELWASQNDPEYYRMYGVGPVNKVALLAQATGILGGCLHYWRLLQRKPALSWIDADQPPVSPEV